MFGKHANIHRTWQRTAGLGECPRCIAASVIYEAFYIQYVFPRFPYAQIPYVSLTHVDPTVSQYLAILAISRDMREFFARRLFEAI